jgi:hypothetical protein
MKTDGIGYRMRNWARFQTKYSGAPRQHPQTASWATQIVSSGASAEQNDHDYVDGEIDEVDAETISIALTRLSKEKYPAYLLVRWHYLEGNVHLTTKDLKAVLSQVWRHL